MGPATDQMSTGQLDDADAERESNMLRSDIEATRLDMSETVDAIQAKLSPQNVQETAEQITERAKKAALDVAEQTTERVKQAALDVSEQVTEKVKTTVNQLKNEIKSEIHDATVGRIERMVDNVRDTTGNASASLIELVSANPIPAALVGIGVAWLFMSKSNGNGNNSNNKNQRYYSGPSGNQGWNGGSNFYANDSNGYGNSFQQKSGQVMDSVSEAASNVKRKAGEVVDNVTEAAGSMKDNVKEKAGELVNQAQSQVGQLTDRVQTQAHQLTDRVQTQAHQVVDRSQSMLENNPLMTSALALTLGAAVGLLLPETQRENELMGEARNKFLGQVSEVAHTTMDKAQKAATEALQNIDDKAQEKLGTNSPGSTGKSMTSEI